MTHDTKQFGGSSLLTQALAEYAVVVIRCFDDRWFVAATDATSEPGRRRFGETIRLPDEHTNRALPQFLRTYPPTDVDSIHVVESPDAAEHSARRIANTLEKRFGENRVLVEPRADSATLDYKPPEPFPYHERQIRPKILRPRNLRESWKAETTRKGR